jgi:hypothetical protein
MITELKINTGKITTISSLDKFLKILDHKCFGFLGYNSIYESEVRQGDGEWMKITKELRQELINHGGIISKMLDARENASQEEERKLQEESDCRTDRISKMTKAIEIDWTNISWNNLQLALSICESLYFDEYECDFPEESDAVEKLLYAVTKTSHLPAMLSNRMLIRINQNLTENNLSMHALASSNKQIETAIRSGNNTKNMAAGAGLIMATQMLGEMRKSDD